MLLYLTARLHMSVNCITETYYLLVKFIDRDHYLATYNDGTLTSDFSFLLLISNACLVTFFLPEDGPR